MFLLWLLPILLLIILGIAYYCYRMTFYVKEKHIIGPDEYPIPNGKAYDPHREGMIHWMKQTRALPHREIYTQSHDGLKLYGKYYEYAAGAPIEIMFHGYRGNADRDLCGGVQRAFALGHNALIVDQRGACHSDGNVITFGVKESRDCRAWVDQVIETFGSDVKIILTGISMGASTVLIAAGKPLPKNVVAVLADCGYTNAKEIIQSVLRQRQLPPKLAYPLVWLGALVFGRFNLSKADATAAMVTCKVPVIFIHGGNDDFVPCHMSKANYDACSCSKKALVTIDGAAHGLSYPTDPDRYVKELREFFQSLVHS